MEGPDELVERNNAIGRGRVERGTGKKRETASEEIASKDEDNG